MEISLYKREIVEKNIIAQFVDWSTMDEIIDRDQYERMMIENGYDEKKSALFN